MIKEKRMTGKICGTGACVPEQIVTNDDLAKMWIPVMNGLWSGWNCPAGILRKMKQSYPWLWRHAEKHWEDSAVSAEDLDMIVVATLTSNQLMPSASCCIQKALEADSALL